jgi:hypothetical protein
VASTSVYVRYNPALAGPHNGNVSIASTGATILTLIVNGSTTVTNIANAISVGSISVFPNPVQNRNLNISFESKEEAASGLEIFNAAGQIMVSHTLQIQAGSNTVNISLQELSAGLYYVKIKGTTILEKIIVQ